MTASLATHVHVRDSAGAAHVFAPGDEIPTWAVALITNPAAWQGGELPAQVNLRTEEPTPPVKRAAPRRKAATTNDDAVQRG